MSTDRDTTRIVRSWLQTDEYESADRVLDAVLDQLDTTPQRRATWWPVRRLPPMNTTAKLALGAVAAALVALIGYTVASGVNIGTTDPSPPASAAASPAAVVLPGRGPLEPGTYRVSNAKYTPVTTEFVVPEGWSANDAGAVGKNADAPSEISMELYAVTHVYRDACDSAGTLEEIGPTLGRPGRRDPESGEHPRGRPDRSDDRRPRRPAGGPRISTPSSMIQRAGIRAS